MDMEVINPNCCGLDVHKKSITACQRMITKEGGVVKNLKTFGTMTEDILELSDWMNSLGVTQVAMESTGVYWKPVWNLLEGEFDVILVNAQHIKQVPGRKTDTKDSEWIAQLLQYGLLPRSFVPDSKIRELRDLTRNRTKLIQQQVSVANRIQKTLEDANIKLSSVASDILGVSGRAMIESLIDGEQDVEKVADLAKRRLREKIPELRKALRGKVTEHHQFMLKMFLRQLDEISALIEEFNRRIVEQLHPFEEELKVLMTIPGIDQKNAQCIIAEIGINMNQYPTAGHLASWAGICPGNNESAGKRKSGKVPKGNRWLRRILCEAAWAAGRTKNTYLSAQYKKLLPRRGMKRSIVAVGHTILIICYHVLRERKQYFELGADYFTKINSDRYTKFFVKKLELLGFKVSLEVCHGNEAEYISNTASVPT